MKRILSLIMVLALMLSMVPAVFAAEKAAYQFGEYNDSNPMKVGTYELTLLETAENTLYTFKPDEIGVYTFTVSEGATVGYWGAGSFYVINPNSTVNSIEKEIKKVGQGAVIGIASSSPNVTLTIEKTGESGGIVETVYVEYVNVHTPSSDVLIPGGLVDVDITQAYDVALGSDGYYHIDGALGPVLYVDLNNSEFNLSNAYGGYGALTMRGVYNGVHYDFKAAMKEYETVVAPKGGLYPVTEDLYAFLNGYGINGAGMWTLKGNDLFAELARGDYHPDSAWMVMCSYVPGSSHTHAPSKVEAVRPTCTVNGNIEYYLCDCGAIFEDAEATIQLTAEEVTVLAMGHGRPQQFEAKRATCTEEGNIEYYVCGVCGAYLIKDEENQAWVEVTPEDVVIQPIGHERVEKFEAKPATCTEAGNYEYYLCGVCGKYLTKDEENQTWNEVSREDIVILPLGHERVDKVEAVAPTYTKAGNNEYWWCNACSAYLQKDEENQQWIELKFPEDIVVPVLPSPFVDVQNKNEFFYNPIMWALDRDITGGISDTEFEPMSYCSRAQVVTFLWRAEGSPAPTSTKNPFKDVYAGQYYYDAVLWAVENGITNGISANEFGTMRNVTRGEFVTFLWRAEKKPAPAGEAPFTDLLDKAYYLEAVAWAAENNITDGISETEFAPEAPCTRGQVITFLYRADAQ